MVANNPLTGILLCTFNGGRFLSEQLASIERQTHPAWQLVVSDDGSTDGTIDIIQKFQRKHPDRVSLITGQGRGFVQNFLAVTAQPAFSAEYWAFCDQDDVWGADKLSRAAAALAEASPDVAALYCSRTMFIDKSGNNLGLSPLCKRAPSFQNALAQNIASGNTMVFNEAARRLLVEANDDAVAFHDWLLYLVVSGCGGSVFYDPYPGVRYRQHGGNVLGPLGGWQGYWNRAGLIFRGEFKSWIDGNLKAMAKIQPWLTEPNRQILAAFANMRQQGLVQRLAALNKLGIAHQSPAGNAAIMLAAICNKL